GVLALGDLLAGGQELLPGRDGRLVDVQVVQACFGGQEQRALGLGAPRALADLAWPIDEDREVVEVGLRWCLLGRKHVGLLSWLLFSKRLVRPCWGHALCVRAAQLRVRRPALIEVLEDVRAAAGSAEREVGAGPAVLEAERRVLVPDVPAPRV